MLVKIKFTKTGEIKEVSDHLAYNVDLQKVQGFLPLDENGAEVVTPEKPVEKKSEPVAEVEIIAPIEIPANAVQEGDVLEIETTIKKRGRKPKNS